MEITAISVPAKLGRFDLFEALQGFDYKDSDILVVSSKFVAMSEGRFVKLDTVRPGAKAKRLAKKFRMDERLAELVLQEADMIVGGIPGFVLAIRKGMMAPNAGIDKSNVPPGHVILYPKKPFASAQKLRQKFLDNGIKLGVILADSRLMPTRRGTTGIAIACAGFEPVEDDRGKRDLFGNTLKVTLRAVADSLATAGVAVMREAAESTPAAVVRGFPVTWTERKLSWKDMAVPARTDIYLRGTGML
ncbi:coenzyme F420-0:L-glutamate ligase [Nitrososphaera sp.]|uniref:coenzyme F420-0:L-glutamate ligase n=1 Tax=Nitrososphaera sp. TaxID=1971748 RepID=UPI001853E14F|nr:coenzyme F420-0:L-glutamate ligase [Nitrososphaera sp.]NWG36155.1 coenzyme F420-0:L-glutamate ligase [Nitrososphaera sp.]